MSRVDAAFIKLQVVHGVIDPQHNVIFERRVEPAISLDEVAVWIADIGPNYAASLYRWISRLFYFVTHIRRPMVRSFCNRTITFELPAVEQAPKATSSFRPGYIHAGGRKTQARLCCCRISKNHRARQVTWHVMEHYPAGPPDNRCYWQPKSSHHSPHRGMTSSGGQR